MSGLPNVKRPGLGPELEQPVLGRRSRPVPDVSPVETETFRQILYNDAFDDNRMISYVLGSRRRRRRKER